MNDASQVASCKFKRCKQLKRLGIASKQLFQVREHEDYKELYDEVEAEIKALPPPILS